MMSKGAIVGVGELVYDHIFVKQQGHYYYTGSRGGGSVFNVLANTAVMEDGSAAIGVGGNDWYGQCAIDELRELGIDITGLSLLPFKRTRVISETQDVRDFTLWQLGSHKFSMVCRVCGSQPPDRALALVRAHELQRALALALDNVGIMCFDRLTQDRVQAARRCQRRGILTVLDIGRVGFLRYVAPIRIATWLSAFDIVLMPSAVANSLFERSGLSLDQLAMHGPRLMLLASKGGEGMNAYHTAGRKLNSGRRFAAPVVDKVVDDAGAGDMVLAQVVHRAAEILFRGTSLHTLDSESLFEIVAEAIESTRPVLGALGARGHVHLQHPITPELPSEWLGMSVEQINSIRDLDAPCPFCGLTDSTKKEGKSSRDTAHKQHVRDDSPVAARNVTYLLKRTNQAASRRLAIEACQEVLKSKGTAYAVGTGGSYTVALFLSLFTARDSGENSGGLFTIPIHPLDYIRIAGHSDTVIVISHSGSTIDCREVVEHAIRRCVGRIIVLTGSARPQLKSALRPGKDLIISYARRTSPKLPGEKGFVSIARTVAPCAVWAAAAVGWSRYGQFVEMIEQTQRDNAEVSAISKLSEALSKGETLHVLGGGLATPAMWDLESKFAEGGLGRIQLHESKDFSHGRFISILGGNSPALFLGVEPWHPYELLLQDVVGSGRRATASLCSVEGGILGSLELLIRVQSLAQLIGESLHKDISRPREIPPRGLELYHWDQGL